MLNPSFKKEDIVKEGFLWRDEAIKVDIPEGVETVKNTELEKYQGYDGSGKWNIDREILKKVIVDEKGNAWKIIPMEYDFLMKHSLPLPSIHWAERTKLAFGF